jgi:AAA15 family ATPase/GTPase
MPRLQFVHNSAPPGVLFDMLDESEGTLQLLRLARLAVGVLESGGILLVDEIDASLHPLLTAKLIGMFHSEVTNTKGAQLIFTSHDTTLLGTLDGDEVLRRDEIWFTEKNPEGVSELYPLAEFKPRKDENRQRRYLSGSYGAIPDLSMQLFEQALASRGSGESDG